MEKGFQQGLQQQEKGCWAVRMALPSERAEDLVQGAQRCPCSIRAGAQGQVGHILAVPMEGLDRTAQSLFQHKQCCDSTSWGTSVPSPVLVALLVSVLSM